MSTPILTLTEPRRAKGRKKMQDTGRPMSYLAFRGLSDEDVMRLGGHCQVTSHASFGSDGRVKRGGLYDLRMGSITMRDKCSTCDHEDCGGHFGHIHVPTPLINPLHFPLVLKLLRSFCFHCNKAVTRITGRGSDPVKVLEKFATAARNKKSCLHCNTIIEDIDIWNGLVRRSGHVIPPAHVRLFLFSLDPADLPRIGVTIPVHCLMNEVILVIPPPMRPVLVVNSIREIKDEITSRYADVVRVSKLYQMAKTDRQRWMLTSELQFIWSMLVLGTDGPGKMTKPKFPTEWSNVARDCRFGKTLTMTSKKKSPPSHHSRLVGKGALIRSVPSKRSNRTARAVAGLLFGRPIHVVGIPRHFAPQLTKEVPVNVINFKHCTNLLRRGKVSHVYVVNEGVTIKINDTNRDVLQLCPGDIVERHLQDGDLVTVIRQPTLQKRNVVTLTVELIGPDEGEATNTNPMRYAILVNSALCENFHLDFDGDELNVNVVASSNAQYLELMDPYHHMLSGQSNKITIAPIQDTITALYMLTDPKLKMRPELLQTVASEMFTPDSTPRGIMRAVIGLKITCRRLEVVDGYYESEEPMTKRTMRKLLHYVALYVSTRAAGDIICRMQRMAEVFHRVNGSSVLIEDLYGTPESEENIKALIAGVKARVDPAATDINGTISSRLTTKIIEMFEFSGANPALEAMVRSGGKGSMRNMVSLMGVTGQQHTEGRPVAGGFIFGNYRDGLNFESDVFQHAKWGRDSVAQTVLSTPKTGHMYRCLTAALADLVVAYDGTVRTSENLVVALRYGGDGYHGARLTKAHTPFDPEDLYGRKANGPHSMHIDAFDLDPLTNQSAVKHSIRWIHPDDDPAAAVRMERRARVEPGEAVGMAAGTYITQPATQLTLDAFHDTASQGPGSGIQALLMIVSLSIKLKVFHTLYRGPRRKQGCVMSEVADVEIMTLADVGVDSQIRVFLSLCRFQSLRRRFVCIRTKPGLGWYPRQLLEALKASEPSVFTDTETHLYPQNNHPDQWLVFVFGSKRSLKFISDVQKRIEAAGIAGISTLGPWVSSTKLHGHMHVGDAMLEMLANGIMSAYSTSIATILSLLGIVGLEEFLYQRLLVIYKEAGIDLDPRHLDIVVQFMVHKGATGPLSYTRHGFGKKVNSVFTQISFESPQQVLLSAITHKHDRPEPVVSSIEKILLGEHARLGTYMCDVVERMPVEPERPQLGPFASILAAISADVLKPKVVSVLRKTEIVMPETQRQAVNFLTRRKQKESKAKKDLFALKEALDSVSGFVFPVFNKDLTLCMDGFKRMLAREFK